MGLWAQGFGKTEPKWQFKGKHFFAQYADDAHRCALMRIRCASADASAWPTLINTLQTTFKIIFFSLKKWTGGGGSPFYEVISQKKITNEGFPYVVFMYLLYNI